MRNALSIGLCALALLCTPLRAADFAGAFLETGLGTRALGMGGAFNAVAAGPDAPNWNPAGLSRARGLAGQTSMQTLALDRRVNTASVALNPRGDMGFGFAWLHASTGDIEGRTASGQRTGSVSDVSNAFLVATGRSLGDKLSIGFAMKIFDQRIEAPFSDASTANGHGFDVGLQYALGKRLTLGVAARNLSASLNWKVRLTNGQSSSTEDPLPRVLSAGIAYRPFAQGTLGFELTGGDETRAHVGGEWTVSPLLTLRSGLRDMGGEEALGQLSAGLSLRPMRSQRLQFHYAYSTDPIGVDARTTVGLEVSF